MEGFLDETLASDILVAFCFTILFVIPTSKNYKLKKLFSASARPIPVTLVNERSFFGWCADDNRLSAKSLGGLQARFSCNFFGAALYFLVSMLFP